jgi:dihydroneopterin aldolase
VADTIQLRGLRVVGRHGVLAEEKERAQPFEVDLDLEVDLSRAGATDALADTVDYGAVVDAVVAVVAGEHSDLLEHLAERIAEAAMKAAGASVSSGPASSGSAASAASGGSSGSAASGGSAVVEAVTVTVRKLRPPVAADLASAGVRIHRRRSGR